MNIMGFGVLFGIVVAIIMISLFMNDEPSDDPVPGKYPDKEEMVNVINYFIHFGYATPYEKEVLQATINYIEGDNEQGVNDGN